MGPESLGAGRCGGEDAEGTVDKKREVRTPNTAWDTLTRGDYSSFISNSNESEHPVSHNSRNPMGTAFLAGEWTGSSAPGDCS